MAGNGSSAPTSCRHCRGGWSRSIYRLIRQRDAAYYALAQTVVIVATLPSIFATARPLVGSTGALVAVLIIDGMHYFQYTAAKFNHDVIQLAVLGARRLRLSCRAQARTPRALAAARFRRRRRAVGKVFCRAAGNTVCAIPAVRSRRSPRAGDRRPLSRRLPLRSSSSCRILCGSFRTIFRHLPMARRWRRRRWRCSP